jgi:hypothetical protein
MGGRSHSVADAAYERVRTICLGFPAAEEKLSHGAPSFCVRGKMFLMFVDDHHGDGRVAVWCKSTIADQRRLVASSPARYFVPPYVGVKGWVGVRIEPEQSDWIELSMLVEEAWLSIAPPRIARGEEVPPAARRPPPSPRVTTDASVARKALERLSRICLALPEAECEHESRHATFRVRKKVFAYFLDNHHGDGIVGVCVRGDKREHARMVEREPDRFYLAAYIGPRGYLGIRLDTGEVDWALVAERTKASYRATAPKALVERVAGDRRPVRAPRPVRRSTA